MNTSLKALGQFAIPLLLQTALIIAIPARAIYTQLSGKTAILQTIAVDPYDPLRGYWQQLRYDISRPENLEKLPGWATVLSPTERGEKRLLERTRVYVILQEPAPLKGKKNLQPQPWKAVAVSRDRPSDLPENRVALEGIYNNGWIDYGLERYYLPEDRREEVNGAIETTLRKAQKTRPIAVKLKVDEQGHSIAQSLWVGESEFQF
ncbi:GDYXXLXY domain-containing protein [Oscillatoria sp. FACHB-1406]|uniref:GDYXXLXY domain-containing protein n=1 Tax=Oscillatoria sp. FACHB-1406 TaxID=2692846 RepID=UPI001685CAB7|nr:GDYXXLXY domain-containing protein [Oscillatoria sp. FACHB-1406]MBD2576643.1 GDYXXLXY domain-containing protein [Oscillatoria sp. FACHB-1406]